MEKTKSSPSLNKRWGKGYSFNGKTYLVYARFKGEQYSLGSAKTEDLAIEMRNEFFTNAKKGIIETRIEKKKRERSALGLKPCKALLTGKKGIIEILKKMSKKTKSERGRFFSIDKVPLCNFMGSFDIKNSIIMGGNYDMRILNKPLSYARFLLLIKMDKNFFEKRLLGGMTVLESILDLEKIEEERISKIKYRLS